MNLRIPLAMHGAIDLAAGLLLMAAPFILGFGAPATFISLLLGALIVGLGLSAAVPEGRGSLGPGAHASYDFSLSVGLIVAGAAAGFSGDLTAFAVLALAGIAGLLLTGVTRYRVSPA